MNDDISRRLVMLAYEKGWGDACHDHLTQRQDGNHPIGRSKASHVEDVLFLLDPHNLLGLR